MNNARLELEEILGKNRVKVMEPLSLHTTFRTGGPAEFYADVQTIEEFVSVIHVAIKNGLPVFVLGGGSNVIVSEKGVKGLVVKNNCRKFEIKGNTVEAQSGVIMNQLVKAAIENGLLGFEYNLGLPGTVGGGIYMNSSFPEKHAHVSDGLQSAKLILKDGTIREVDASYVRFENGRSKLWDTGEIILSVVFSLTPGDKEVLRKIGAFVLASRTNSQQKGGYIGCTYRNISLPQNIIDKAGLKGKRVGMAMIAHTDERFIINLGGVYTKDVVTLTKLIKQEIREKFGVDFVYEIRIIGN